MSYNNIEINEVSTIAIELSLSASQTVGAGDKVIFNTIRASHSGHGVSVDAFGNITLNTNRKYWIQASFDITRSSTTSDIRLDFADSSGTALDYVDGAFPAEWEYHVATSAGPNATFTATYVTKAPLSSINLKVTTIAANSTVNVGTRVLILESA
jgi:hypothetical protein